MIFNPGIMLTNHREAKSVNFSTYPAALESSQYVLVAYFRVDSEPKQWPCFKGHDLRKFQHCNHKMKLILWMCNHWYN